MKETSSITYVGGFSSFGRGTPDGPEKDRVMRGISQRCIVELFDNSPSSSKTTLDELGMYEGEQKITVMLARNGKLKGTPLKSKTIKLLQLANINICDFVVGDYPEVDEPFVDFLVKLNTNITIYHAGNDPRFKK